VYWLLNVCKATLLVFLRRALGLFRNSHALDNNALAGRQYAQYATLASFVLARNDRHIVVFA
jgi:hypothetical protein